MENVTLNVKGMSCGHCVKAVEGSVGKLTGINEVKVHLDAGKVEVAFDKEKVSLETIKEAIDDQGYDVE
ncbi:MULTISPECIES: copper chaperone CopZ [Metabacillus]|jgi:copper chaperone|uniref:Copper chaperone CopZ n=1 Tax=Metabacillus rhizolycopersici TaxID=2875709 RepID=A0ABS7URT8_9BACI|nr:MULTISPECIES: copper chaperone CopZ [Metabacillus]MBZ5751021.1 copper chaperone CopZ [Metabacillus rhizolycopersici]MCM3652486.1 copper chaperone CopZ [Metabacillus litoralis]